MYISESSDAFLKVCPAWEIIIVLYINGDDRDQFNTIYAKVHYTNNTKL